MTWPITLVECVQALKLETSTDINTTQTLEAAFTDSRKPKKNGLFVAIKGEKFDGHAYVEQVLREGTPFALVDKKWFESSSLTNEFKSRCLVSQDVLKSFRSLAAYFRNKAKFPVFGIGGSNGKTTTKEILTSLLAGRGSGLVLKTEKSENGYLGIAITLTQDRIRKENIIDALVLEIGIDATGAMAEHVTLSHPDCSILTALGPEHIEGLGSWQNAIAEEMKLFDLGHEPTKRIWNVGEEHLLPYMKNVREGDTLVFTQDQLHLACEHTQSSSLKDLVRKNLNIFLYQIKNSDLFEQKIEWTWFEKGKEIGKFGTLLPLPGNHNAGNFCVAAAAALTMGWTHEEILKGFTTFTPPPQRSAIKKFTNGSVLIDDCYNASPLSMKAALQFLFQDPWDKKEKMVVLGDMLELGEESKKWHLDLVPLLGKIKKTAICLYGEEMKYVFDELVKIKHKLEEANSSVTFLSKQENPIQFLNDVSTNKSLVLLVKGSRGMGLERVVQHYLQHIQKGEV